MARKDAFIFQMPFAQTDHINKKIYLLEQDGCQPIYTPIATCDAGAVALKFVIDDSVGDHP